MLSSDETILAPGIGSNAQQTSWQTSHVPRGWSTAAGQQDRETFKAVDSPIAAVVPGAAAREVVVTSPG